MNAQDALKLARRFIELPLQKRHLFIKGLRQEGVEFSLFPIPQGVAAEDRDALSYAQQRMWFLWQLDPQSAAYNLPGAVRLRGHLHEVAVEQAFASLIERHETLRTVFERRSDDSLHQVPCEVPLVIEREDFSELSEAEREARLLDEARQQAAQPFDLGCGPLLRVKLLRLRADEHVLLLTLHHIVSDGWSMNVLIDEFTAFYDAHQQGLPAQLPSLTIQYSDYALWQRRWLEAGEQARQLEYWQAQLGDEHPPLELPLDHPRPAVSSYRGVRQEFVVDHQLVEQLRGLAQRHNITLFMLLLGSFNVLLHRYTGQSDIRVGVPIANRNRNEVEGLIGFFVNTQVLRTRLDGQSRVSDVLQAVKQAALGAQAHQDLPFERLVEALKLERSLSHTPLFQVMYNHQPQVADISSIKTASGLRLEPVENQGRSTQFDLTLDTWEKGGRLHAALTYASDLFEPETIERMARHWLNLLQAIVQDPQQCVGELSMLDASEYQTLIHDWNHNALDYPNTQCIHELIAARVATRPNALALIDGEQQLSYQQLDSRANQLAHKLIELGVGPEVRVGVAMARSSELIVALLAVLKAGGAYVPLDPQYPAERVAYMLEDSQALVLLTETEVFAGLPSTQATVVLLDDASWLTSYPATAPVLKLSAQNLAYVIYTSGSTGKPKGVAIAHRNVAALIHWSQQVYSRDDLQGVLASTSVCFDLSVWEIFVTLASGGFIVLADNALALPELPARERVRLINSVPSAIAGLQRLGQIPPGVRIINLAGEPLKQALVEALYQLPHIDHVYDLYGPSEDTTYSTWTRRAAGGTANIGRPLSNTRSYLLDGDLQPVPIGVPAELYLAGAGITRGYLLRPGLTAERFVPDPFSTGERLYRTGDLARYRADGVIEYIGRIDHQIKLRGFRIELGEIEARLLQHPDVKDAVVLVHEGKTLVAYVVLRAASDDTQNLNQQLKNHVLMTLPDYMTPSVFVQLEQLPITPNGKLDRKALPAPDAQQTLVFSAPASRREIVLAEIWQQLLGLDQVGLDDNFFELGGDSIVSIQVVSRARQAGLSLTPRDLFQYQTLRGLAEVAVEELAPLVNRETVSGEVLLTPIQHWFFQQPIPQREHWNQAVLLSARQAVDVPALTQALDWLVQQHDALRLRFSGNAEGWQQRYVDRATMELWQRTADSAEQLREHCNAAQASLDLQDGPLLRALLVDMTDGSQRLLLVVHHLVVDGVSWRVLLEDLQQAYARLQRGEGLVVEHKTSSFQQWSARLADYANSPELQAELAYWQAHTQATLQDLPRDHPEGRQTNAQASRISLRLDAQHTRQLLQQAPAAYRTQVNDLLLTALSRVICRWTGHDATLIQLEGHGREQLFDDVDLTRTVGWFTSLYPLRLVPVSDVAGSITAIKEQLRSVPNKGIGYGILRYLAADKLLETGAQPRITFNYLGQFDQQFSEEAVFAPAMEGSGEGQSSQAPLANWLSIEGQVFGGELLMEWNFSHEMFDPATIQRLVDAYADELKALIEHCCDTQNRGVTPADFPLARLTQQQLDQLRLPADQIEDIYPLSPMQQGMLFHFQYAPDTRHYINQMRLDIEGLDPERFRQAWQAALDAHPVLRTQFLWQGDLPNPLQVVRKQLRVPFVEHDWRTRDDLPEALNALADADQQPFDLSRAPLLRLQLVRTAPTHYHLIYTHHHILLDGWSNTQLLGEILQRYHGGFQSGVSAGYADYIGWLQAQDPSLSEVFWRGQLADLAEPTQLAQRSATVAVEQHADHYQTLDIEQTRRLSEFARQQKVTVNTLLQAAWLLLLQRYTGQVCVCFGATVSGRPGHLRGIEQQLGLFINTLPVIANPRAEQRLDDWLQQLQTLNLNLREHEHTPLAEIQRWAQLDGGALFDSLLVFENYPISAALEQGAGAQLSFGAVRNNEQAHYPLTLAIGLGEQLSLHYSYAVGHFDEALIRQIDGHLRALLLGMVEQPDALLGNLGFDQQATLEQWNPHRVRFNIEHSLAQRIEAQVERSPDAIALSFDGEQLTYGELNQQANRVAHQLIARGVGPEVRVGLAVERGLEMIVGLLAILKAGGAYVPLDPAYPQDRLSYMIQDSGIRLLLAQAGVLEELPLGDEVEILLISPDTPQRLNRGQAPLPQGMHSSTGTSNHCRRTGVALHLARDGVSPDDPMLADTPLTRRSALARDGVRSDELAETETPHREQGGTPPRSSYREMHSNPEVRVNPHNLAYVIYTSGSTGQPKGALLTHANVLRLFEASARHFRFGPDDVWTLFHSCAFDFSVWEIFGALLYGGKLVIVPHAVSRSPEDFHALLIEQQVTVLNQTPSAFKPLISVACAAQQNLALRYAIFGGEALDVPSLKLWLDHFGDQSPQLINMYGITETTVHVTYRTITTADIKKPGSPIGAPLADLSWYLLDANLNPVPKGCIGELYVGGPGLARGYLNRQDLTAIRFIPNPFAESGSRLYRTGDVARYRSDGSIDYLGRSDHQVKIRGFRIELGEIEAQLLAQPQVCQAVVLAQDTPGGRQLVAYVVADESIRENLKTALKDNLPDYMVPAHLIFLPSLPLTANGKLDRKALPTPDASHLQGEYVTPQTELEQQIAQIWQDVLKLERVGLTDNFFELGGHSLLAAQVIARIKHQLSVAAGLRDLFTEPQLRGFAARLAGQNSETVDSTSVELVAAETGSTAPLSLAQRRLWVAEQFSSGSGAYGMPLALRLRGALDIEVLKDSFVAVIQRHEVLRTSYTADDEGDPIAVVAPRVAFELPMLDLSQVQRMEQEARVAEATLNNTRQAISLEQAPLLRAQLLRLSASEHVLLYSMHHIISDGWSMSVLISELVQHYAALQQASESPLPPLPVQYSDYARWQLQLERAGVLAEQGRYWQKALAGSSGVLPLLMDFPRPAHASYAGANLQFSIPEPLRLKLETLSRGAGVTLYSTLLAAFQVLLHRVTGSDDLLVGADVAGRQRPELESLIGFFVNILPLRSRFDAEQSFASFLAATQDTALSAFEQQDLPLDVIVEASGVPRQRGVNPLVQVLFVMNNLPLANAAIEGIAVEVLPTMGGYSKFDMALFLDQNDGQLQGTWQFASDLFKPERIQQLLDSWLDVLDHIVRDPAIKLREISVASHRAETRAGHNAGHDAVLPVSTQVPAKPKVDKLSSFLKKPGKPVNQSATSLFRESPMVPGQPFPLLVEPVDAGLDLIEWVKANRPLIEQKLSKHAGLLFRGFQLHDIHAFEAFAEAVQPGLYGQYGDLPKKEGGKNTYRSTPYPEKKMILFHNESSHQDRWPRKQLFFCEQPSPVGGATPVVDCRLMYQSLPAPLRDRFESKGLLYVRTFADKLDVSWQHFFKTEQRAEVEARCEAAGIQWQWLDNDELQIRTPCPAIIRHPVTGEKSFFNQVQLHHIYCLDPDVRDDLLALFGEQRMPRHVYYGDGSPIEDAVMQQIGELYEQCAVRFDWQKGDVILLDNMLAAHARDPFEGPRKIVVAMGEMIERGALQQTKHPLMEQQGTDA